MKAKSAACGFIALGVCSLASACGGNREGHLLDSNPESVDEDAESRRLQQMQLVRLFDAEDPSRTVDIDAEYLANYRSGGCFAGPSFQGNGCELVLTNLRRTTCVTEVLLALAQDNPEGIATWGNFDGSETRQWVAGPQSAAAKAALAQHAIPYLVDQIEYAAWILAGVRPPQPPQTVSPYHCRLSDLKDWEIKPDSEVNVTVPLGEWAASRLVGGYHDAKAAFDIVIENTLSVADAQRSSTPSMQLAAARSGAGVALSRAAAAHLLVGGEPGIFGSTTRGLCDAPRLTAQAKAALAVLRESGVHPLDVLATSDFERRAVPVPGDPGQLPPVLTAQLLDATGTNADPGNPSWGSVLQRLQASWGVQIDPAVGVAEHFGLREEDFDQARRYLAQEILAFGRTTRPLESLDAPCGGPGDCQRFAGTATNPPERPAAYYAALAQTEYDCFYCGGDPPDHPAIGGDWRRPHPPPPDVDPESYSGPGIPIPSLSGTVDNLAHLVGFTYAWASFLLSKQTSYAPDGQLPRDIDTEPLLERGVIAPLAQLVSGRELAGRLTDCRGSTTRYIIAQGFSSEDDLFVVRGTDSLECAVHGNVEGAHGELEGAPCEIDEVIHLTEDYVPGADWPKDPGFDKAVAQAAPMTASAHQEQWYLIRPRVPLPGTQTIADYDPGEWEALAAMVNYTHYSPSVLDVQCRDIPIVPEAMDRLRDVLAPSREWCSDSSVSCAGTRFDERIPLEDELASDGDGVESSWRHYLNLAREAAAESDRLGLDYVHAGLEQDLREEELDLRRRAQEEKAMGEIEGLQAICGTAVDPVGLLDRLGRDEVTGDFDLSSIDAGSCAADDTLCVHDRGVLDWQQMTEDPELQSLGECVNQFDAKYEFVHLGNSDLCVWMHATEGLCGGHYPGYRCPEPAPEDGQCEIPLDPAVQPMEIIPATQGLGFFDTDETLPPPQIETLCDDIRRMRAARDPAKLDELTQSNRLATPRLRPLRDRLGLELRYGGFVALTIDGVEEYSTGSPTGGVNTTRWPCSEDGRPASCADGEGFFCESFECGDPEVANPNAPGLIAANRHLIDAYLAAELTTWTEGDPPVELPLPHFLYQGAEPKDAPPQQVFLHPADYPIDKHVNDSGWAMFTGDIVLGDVAANTAANISVLPIGDADYWHIAPFGSDNPSHGLTRFAIRAVEETPVELLQDFWGGLSLGSHSDGYLRALLDWDFVRENPGDAYPVNFYSEHYIRNKTCRTGCVGVDSCCRNDIRRQVREALSRDGLRSDDPREARMAWQSGSYLYEYGNQSLLDGLELICLLAEGGSSTDAGCDSNNPPEIRNLRDLERMGNYMKCMGDKISHRAATAIFPDFPVRAVDAMREHTGGAYDPELGRMGEAISQLRSAMMQVASSAPIIGRTVRNFGEDMVQLRHTMAIYDIRDEMGDIQFQANVAQQVANCISAGGEAMKGGGHPIMGWIGGGISSTATCANSIAQISFADSLRDLGEEETRHEREIAISDFNQRFNDHIATLETESINLSEALEQARRQLGVIQSLKQEAARSVNSALWHLSYQAANEGEINSVIGKRNETLRIRYERAHQHAKRMAFLAKRAIEQRLAIPLSEMREDLPLVEAPSSWESTVCETSGIDYESLRSEDSPPNFADAFIGDYVSKLENVLESYRLVHNFHEGSDTAVVSLRDDIVNVRAECEQESSNLLAYASQLNRLSAGYREGREGWFLDGCALAEPAAPPDGQAGAAGATGIGGAPSLGGMGSDSGGGGAGGATEPGDVLEDEDDSILLKPHCVSVEPHTIGLPILYSTGTLPSTPTFQLGFGDDGYGNCDEPGACGWQPGAGLVQRLELGPGRYIYSWYAKEFAQGSTYAGFVRVGEQMYVQPTGNISEGNGYRSWIVFDLAEQASVTLGFQRPSQGMGGPVLVAAPMVERLDSPHSDPVPGVFEDATGSGVVVRRVCEDTDGENFRLDRWTRGAMNLCPDGYSSDCTDRADLHPYSEISFHVNQRAIEEGVMFNQSGFARGNFNYRIESIGLNFVGTGIRDCSDSDLPSTCYAGGYVPYTMIHEGPYYVRNHLGDDYRSRLFTGRIEHGRGLATERYLSNPVSSADQELLAPFIRNEFQGRPLDGNFVLRVWDDPDVNFDAIEDVQIILHYRYWTRFE